MLFFYLQGFALGTALILPLGPQNVFVMNQGIKCHYALMTAGLCTLSDGVLICGGIFGGSAVLNQSPTLLMVITWGGVAFLLGYGWRALRSAWQGEVTLTCDATVKQGRWRIIVTLLAVTWLNPHVYLDTFVVLGSLGGQLPSTEARCGFAFGAISASVIWFYGLALLAAWLSPQLCAVGVQRVINLLVGGIMWFIALQLARQSLMEL